MCPILSIYQQKSMSCSWLSSRVLSCEYIRTFVRMSWSQSKTWPGFVASPFDRFARLVRTTFPWLLWTRSFCTPLTSTLLISPVLTHQDSWWVCQLSSFSTLTSIFFPAIFLSETSVEVFLLLFFFGLYIFNLMDLHSTFQNSENYHSHWEVGSGRRKEEFCNTELSLESGLGSPSSPVFLKQM